MKTILSVLALILCNATASAQEYEVTAADRGAVVTKVIDHLRQDYVDPAVGQRAAETLSEDMRSGRFCDLADGKAFADDLGNRLRELTGDGHLNVEFSAEPVDVSTPKDAAFEAAELDRYYGAHLNFGVQTVGRIDGNVGYFDLRAFAPVSMGGDTVVAAMNVLSHTDAMIIDLRKNGGGMGDMADLIASYLFEDERRQLTGVYDRPSDTLTQRFTQPHVAGQRFGSEKPVYVLISKQTFSAAEALAYNLQALERATIVGETSGGGAHPFEYLPIHRHFVLWSVTAKSVNPITGSNWQSVGVKPDVAVPSDDALDAALAHLRSTTNKSEPAS